MQETQQAGMYIPSLPCLAGSADTPAPPARGLDLELVDFAPTHVDCDSETHPTGVYIPSPLHSLPCLLVCNKVLGMLPANCQDKTLPRPALLLGHGGEFEKDLIKHPPVFAVQRYANFVCHHPSYCSDI